MICKFIGQAFVLLASIFLSPWEGFSWLEENTYCQRGNFLRWNLHNRGITVQMMSFVYKILFYADKVFAKDVKVLYNMKHRYSSTAKGQEPG